MTKKVLFLFLGYLYMGLSSIFAQSVVSGIVVSEEQMPLPGVSIFLNGVVQGVSTDKDGEFSITVSQGDKLKFSFVGFEEKEMEVGATDKTLKIVLSSSSTVLSDVVLTGYGTKKRALSTSSSENIGQGTLNIVPIANPVEAIQGKVSGVNISQTSGTPGTPQNINIRGIGSISASNQPLIVVDGVIFNSTTENVSTAFSQMSTLSLINYADVESITILKDAGSTAMYGASGSNGVIVITTKNGNIGSAPSLTYTSSIGFQQQAVEGRTMLTGNQKLELWLEAIKNDNPVVKSKAEAEAFARKNNMYPTTWEKDGKSNINWRDHMLNKNPMIQQHNLSFSGGVGNSRYFASTSYNTTQGIAIGSDFERLTVNFKYQTKPTDWIDWDISVKSSGATQNGVAEQGAYYTNPMSLVYFGNPWISPIKKDGKPNLDIGDLYNPLYITRYDITRTTIANYSGATNLGINFFEGFAYNGLFSANSYTSKSKQWNNPFYGDYKGKGNVEDDFSITSDYLFRNTLSYDMSLLETHHISIQYIGEASLTQNNYLYGSGKGFYSLNLKNLVTATSGQSTSSSFNHVMGLANMGVMSYNYNETYLLNVTFRNEATSRLSPKNRFGNFYSVGVGYNLHKEAFMEGLPIQELKLRANYGTSGNLNNLGYYDYLQLISFSGEYNENPVAYIPKIANEKISWESNYTYEVGVDYAIMDKILSGSVTYYNRVTHGLIQNMPISNSIGFGQMPKNIGIISNSGVEMLLKTSIINTPEISFDITSNFSFNQNKVLDLAKDEKGVPKPIVGGLTKTIVGSPIRSWYMPVWGGVNPQTGLGEFVLKNGSKTTNYVLASKEENKSMQGSGTPIYQAGMGFNLSFYNFFASTNFAFMGGHKIYENWNNFLFSHGANSLFSENGYAELMNRWQKAGDKVSVPKLNTKAGNLPEVKNSTRFLYNGDFIRWKNASIGYNITELKEYASWIKELRFSLVATNFMTLVFDKRLQWDPESPLGGESKTTSLYAPITATYSMGINLKF